jgi:hypothetical protein
MQLWDKDFLDMMEPAYIVFDGKSGGEFAFGCVTGGLHCRKSRSGVEFTWEGNNEMDQASGAGWAELQKMARSPGKSASTTVTIQPSRLAGGDETAADFNVALLARLALAGRLRRVHPYCRI